jgi:hypothetical protein
MDIGPTDYKVSFGGEDSTIVEFKLEILIFKEEI